MMMSPDRQRRARARQFMRSYADSRRRGQEQNVMSHRIGLGNLIREVLDECARGERTARRPPAPVDVTFGLPLTHYHVTVLLLASLGCSERETAHELGRSIPTVKDHRAEAKRRLGVATLREAVLVLLKAMP